MWPEQQRLQLAAPSEEQAQPTPQTLTQSRIQEGRRTKKTKRGFYWIKPLLTVLENDGKNLETQGGLYQQALFAQLSASHGLALSFLLARNLKTEKKNMPGFSC